MAAVMAAAVATLLTVEALPTQHAAALPTAAPAQAAAQQTNVLEAVHPAARSLAAPPSMITIIVWRIITGLCQSLTRQGLPMQERICVETAFRKPLNAPTLEVYFIAFFLEFQLGLQIVQISLFIPERNE